MVKRLTKREIELRGMSPAQLAAHYQDEEKKEAERKGFAGYGSFERMMKAFITGNPDAPNDTRVWVRRTPDMDRLLDRAEGKVPVGDQPKLL